MTEEEKKAIEYFRMDIEKRKQGKNYFVDYEKVMLHEETILNLIQKQQKEIEKKDKIIKRQAIFIANTDIDEDICKYQTGKFCKKEIYEVPLSICVKCVKQYFENKVEGE